MATSLHWLVVFSYITMFYGTIIPIMVADKSSSKSISNCVATGLPRAIFTTTAVINTLVIGWILFAFYIWNREKICKFQTFMKYYLGLHLIIGICSIISLSLLAFLTVFENHDAHMFFALMFFSLSYAHCVGSLVLPFVIDDGDPFNGWHVLRICLCVCGTLVIVGTQHALSTDNWTMSNFEWLYISTYLTYIFTFWNEMKDPVFEFC